MERPSSSFLTHDRRSMAPVLHGFPRRAAAGNPAVSWSVAEPVGVAGTPLSLEGSMLVKGVTYDVGTQFGDGGSSRTVWTTADVARDVRAIHRDLHCNSVNFFGGDQGRLIEAATLALEEGLAVSIQPRPIDHTPEDTLEFLAGCAAEAERLRARGPVTLNTGCEATIFTSGFVPGDTFRDRMKSLLERQSELVLINQRLNEYMLDVVRITRERFAGTITYGAGLWEEIDWSGFDLMGVNFYRDKHNTSSYASELRRRKAMGKPLVVTEFGCCAFEGAEEMGGAGWLIVDRSQDPPVIKPGYTRSEETQARELTALLDIYEAEGLHGAYVFDFMAANYPHHSDPRRDLDMAGYGIVKVLPQEEGDTSVRWVRKLAFDAVARHYAAGSGLIAEASPG
jgi:hypothetical protein